MILEEKSVNKVVHGGNMISDEHSMQIKASSKAFKVLSDNLYSDKIKAIIRELSCNAFDSHVDKGNKEKPFHVTLPNGFNPNFMVRDFGTGISHENIYKVYTVFFESTKTDPNKDSSYHSTGMLGLGCKSPLSYVDSFLVNSYFENKKNSYSVYKNEEGIPCCKHLFSEDSSEESGLEVIIPVLSKDFYNFKNKAKEVFKDFSLKPEIFGENINIPEKEYELKSDSFGVRSMDYQKAKAIMGNISYPLSDLSDNSLTDGEKEILQSDIDFFFDLGKLDFSASRESLSYDKITIKNIKLKLKDFICNIQSAINEKLNSCENLWDARCKVVNLYNTNYKLFASLHKDDHIHFKYKNENVDDWHADLSAFAFIQDVETKQRTDNFILEKCEFKGDKLFKRSLNTNLIKASEKVHIFINDEKRHLANSKIKFFHQKNPNKTIYIIKLLNDYVLSSIENEIGMGKLPTLSSVELPEVMKTYTGKSYSFVSDESLKKYNSKIFLFDQYNYDNNTMSSYWKKVDNFKDIEKEKCVYVKIDRFKIDSKDPSEHIKQYLLALKECKEELGNIKVYGVKKSIKAPSTWKTLESFTKETVKNYLTKDINFIRYSLIRSNSLNFINYESQKVFKFLNSHDIKNKDIKIIIETLKSENDISIRYPNSFYIISSENDYGFLNDEKNKVKNSYSKVIESYPLLSYLATPYSSHERETYSKALVDYLKS